VPEALRRHGQEIETEDGGRYAGINPESEPASPEEGEKNGDEDDA
jgi:hypothetical protein